MKDLNKWIKIKVLFPYLKEVSLSPDNKEALYTEEFLKECGIMATEDNCKDLPQTLSKEDIEMRVGTVRLFTSDIDVIESIDGVHTVVLKNQLTYQLLDRYELKKLDKILK